MKYQTLDYTFTMRMTEEERARLADLANADSRSAADWLRVQINKEYERLLADGHKEREGTQ